MAFLGLVTAVATGVGVIPVYLVDLGEQSLGGLWGVSAGVMATISVVELLQPGLDEPGVLAAGAGAGVVFVLLAARWLEDTSPGGEEAHAAGVHSHRGHQLGSSAVSSLSLLLFLVFTVHSAPEGVGIGSALKADAVAGLAVVTAIAVHNVPEGTAVAVGLHADGVPFGKAVGWAIVTSLPQPLLAPIVFLVAVGPWLTAGLGFAGGAMLALVATEVAPEGLGEDRVGFAVGSLIGLAGGLALHVLLASPV